MKKQKITLDEFQSIVDNHASLSPEIQELEAKRDRVINIVLARYNASIAEKEKEKKDLYKQAKKYALKNRKSLFHDDSKTAETNLATYSFRLSPETLAHLITMHMTSIAPENANYVAYPSRSKPGIIDISIQGLTPIVPVDGFKFLTWLKSPESSFGKAVNMLNAKSKRNRKKQ